MTKSVLRRLYLIERDVFRAFGVPVLREAPEVFLIGVDIANEEQEKYANNRYRGERYGYGISCTIDLSFESFSKSAVNVHRFSKV